MDDYELLREQRVQELAREIEEQTIERLYDAATHISVEAPDADAVSTGIHTLESDGFQYDDENNTVLISGYAAPDFHYELEDAMRQYRRYTLDKEADMLAVHGVEIHLCPTLPDGTLLLIHDKALAPSLSRSVKPFVVRHEDGLVVVDAE